MRIRRIGVLTGGGDAPGLNPALKAIVYRATAESVEVLGLPDGWYGLLDAGIGEAGRLEDYQVRRWDRDGGTNLGSSRTNPFHVTLPGEARAQDRSDEVMTNIARLGLDAVIALGGEDTLGVAHRLSEKGCQVVGIPKTIDKDLSHTDYTLGFDTALRNCTSIIRAGAHPGRLASLGAGSRGHGPACRSSGPVERGCRRRDPGPYPRVSVYLRTGL